ncbi:NAD(P)H-dependent glycerol-3-phosphate dehydrogenase [Lichenicoccus roseus]|uniref:Glycerol-3-phosphate dehydrogenase [NAD(P)+] n=1 Tax=Lichenicoccus roseus TaxID=2683649 RepID=A0A5R9JE43_9PROT|nr:NAD(P)H-dependent glycerol-3-phosphate dehydrogenase [Lichenicoccus roseus]TLU73686.1 NAD(P)H-dependent glycerol-3-phosphate dehydrogenase [Lichenicoccus roseus]
MSEAIAVVGAGAWGIGLAIQAARTGHPVTLWGRSPQRRGADGALPRLPGIAVPDSVALSDRLPASARLVLLAVPVQNLRAVATGIGSRAPMIACCKGIERGTHRMPLEILAELHPGVPLGVLSGPNFAHEVASGLPAAAVLACADALLGAHLARMVASENFRVYPSDDVVGVQLGGAAKNVIAIAAGAASGNGLGENARAAIITRGIAEISRLIVALGGRAATAAGLSGLGDLVLTCTGATSRNYSLGVALGRGESLTSILSSRSTVAEGVETAPALASRAALLGVGVPVIEVVALLLAGSLTLDEARALLLARPIGPE